VLDQDVCIACRREYAAVPYDAATKETSLTWICGVEWRRDHILIMKDKDSVIPKGCRKLFEQLLAAERKNDR
jgi:hypothetical protein